jgi:hypothetical protein
VRAYCVGCFDRQPARGDLSVGGLRRDSHRGHVDGHGADQVVAGVEQPVTATSASAHVRGRCLAEQSFVLDWPTRPRGVLRAMHTTTGRVEGHTTTGRADHFVSFFLREEPDQRATPTAWIGKYNLALRRSASAVTEVSLHQI